MFIGVGGGHSTAGGAVQKALLNQKWFVDFLDGVFFLADRHRQSRDADRASFEFADDDLHNFFVHFVQAPFVHIQALEGVEGQVVVDGERDMRGLAGL